MRIPAIVVALVVLTSPLAPAQGPDLVLRPAGLTLRRLPPLLSEQMVARHLDTGLTTSFVFSVDAGRSLRGAAQIRIRYDLWDERYTVERRDARPDSPAAAVLTKAGLGEWWRSLELVVSSSVPSARPEKAKITLQVLPFSQTEQRDAQEWLLRSFRTTGENAPPGEGSPASEAPLRNLYGSMLAASIGQRSLITYSWTVPVTVESR